jgi:hypothetical protein
METIQQKIESKRSDFLSRIKSKDTRGSKELVSLFGIKSVPSDPFSDEPPVSPERWAEDKVFFLMLARQDKILEPAYRGIGLEGVA